MLRRLFIEKVTSVYGEQYVTALGVLPLDQLLSTEVKAREDMAIGTIKTDLVTLSGYEERIRRRSCSATLQIIGAQIRPIEAKYTIQPQEDMKSLVVSAQFDLVRDEQSLGITKLYSALLLNTMFAKEIEARKHADATDAKLAEDREAGRQEKEKEEAEQSAIEQKNALKDRAISANALANQHIGEIWKNIPTAARTPILEQQRAWIKKKETDCGIEAAGKSTDQTERETARLECDTRFTSSRAQELLSLVAQPAPAEKASD